MRFCAAKSPLPILVGQFRVFEGEILRGRVAFWPHGGGKVATKERGGGIVALLDRLAGVLSFRKRFGEGSQAFQKVPRALFGGGEAAAGGEGRGKFFLAAVEKFVAEGGFLGEIGGGKAVGGGLAVEPEREFAL